MNPPDTSLDRMHDIVPPDAVAWWPPAPGWYAVLGLILVAAAYAGWRSWSGWCANAYRRAALRELSGLQETSAIAELLRRVALAIAPRVEIAEKTGTAWVDWVAAQSSEAMPLEVRQQLTVGVYERLSADHDVSVMRDYVAQWITHHRPFQTENSVGQDPS